MGYDITEPAPNITNPDETYYAHYGLFPLFFGMFFGMNESRIRSALERRISFFEKQHKEETDCYRLFHGATEGIPGLSIDRYGPTLLIQTWREPLTEERANLLADLIRKELSVPLLAIWNHRQKRGQVQHHPLDPLPETIIGSELGIKYLVPPIHKGIDPLLFLDFRAARRWIRDHSLHQSIVNLFSYTCGIGVAGCIGGGKVCNVDFSTRSLEIGIQNAELNSINTTGKNPNFYCIKDDVFPVIRQFSGLGIKGRAARKGYIKREKQDFDIVVLDPPRISKSPFGKVDLVGDYPSLFKPALMCTKPGGWLLATNNVSSMTHSRPLLRPKGEELLEDISMLFQKNLVDQGLSPYRVVVTSGTRSIRSQSKLEKVNDNAASESAHWYGYTFDISFGTFVKKHFWSSSVDGNVLKKVLDRTLSELRQQGDIWVIAESGPSCFHITLRCP